MPNDIEMMMDAMIDGNSLDYDIWKTCNDMFILQNDARPERFGLHLTDVTKPFVGSTQLCIRQHTFGSIYTPRKTPRLGVKQLRVFLEGWYVHLKWQQLFKQAGYAVEIEKTRLDPIWQVYHTPDIIAKFPHLTGDDLWIIEIKSMNPDLYYELFDKNNIKDPFAAHKEGYTQAQMYMYLTDIKRAMLLIENKGNQYHIELSFEYDPDFVAPLVHRLNILSQSQTRYINHQGAPKRISYCKDENSSRARNCPMGHVCWIESRTERDKYLRQYEHSEEQINASLVHTVDEKLAIVDKVKNKING